MHVIIKQGVLCLALVSAGCTGAISDNGGGSTRAAPGVGAGGSQSPSGKAGSGGTGDDTVMSPSPAAALPACLPAGDGLTLRRLTRDEYDNTVRDLLGDTSRPGGAFPGDVSSHGFDNNVSTLTVPSLLAEKYVEAAETLVESFWTREGAAGRNARVRVCEPVVGREVECAQKVLQAFLPRAWRRPVTAVEITALVKVVEEARQRGDSPETGIKLALQVALLSPHFLFRIEADGGTGKPLAPYAMASRLSYFFWSTMPDERLLSLATDGSLMKPEVVRTEAKRMLADPKASALITHFASQWLDLRRVDGLSPSKELFPQWNAMLGRAMREETELFVRAFLSEDRSALDMIDADFTFLNQKLAEHYQLWGTGVGGDQMKRATIPASSVRGGGLLTQGSILGITSTPERTSVIHRGVWVLKHLLCDQPPPPPPDAPPLPPATAGKDATLRERTEAHRANPACAACHNLIDPIGFGLENYDPIGKWRESDSNVKIDATGVFRGKPFKGPRELAAVIKADPGFAACFVKTMYSYALGRTPAAHDQPALDGLTKTFATKGHRLSELMVDVAASQAFASPCGR